MALFQGRERKLILALRTIKPDTFHLWSKRSLKVYHNDKVRGVWSIGVEQKALGWKEKKIYSYIYILKKTCDRIKEGLTQEGGY